MSFKQKHIDVLILDDSLKTIDSVNVFSKEQLKVIYRGTNISSAISNLNSENTTEQVDSESISRFLSIDMQFFSLEEFVTIISSFESGIALIFCEKSQKSSLEAQIKLLEIIFNNKDSINNIDFVLEMLPERTKEQYEMKSRSIKSKLTSEIKKIPDKTKENEELRNRESLLRSLQKDDDEEITGVDYSAWANDITD